jgi:GntR family transcriptional regulator, sialic acid-inducible nan operon repressor
MARGATIGNAAARRRTADPLPLAPKALERRRLSEQVTAELEQLIVSGRLKAGATLPSERELMGVYGVGRTSIREALFALQRKGVVSAQPGLRPIVSLPKAATLVADLSGTVRLFLASEVGMREFQLARRFFEPAIARFAAQHATPDDHARMSVALASCDAAQAQPEAFVDADVDFHFAMVQATHSELLIALHRAVLEWLREQRISSMEPLGSTQAAQRAHRRILEAIVARDPDRAERAMLGHLTEVESYYWKARDTASRARAATQRTPKTRDPRRKPR